MVCSDLSGCRFRACFCREVVGRCKSEPGRTFLTTLVPHSFPSAKDIPGRNLNQAESLSDPVRRNSISMSSTPRLSVSRPNAETAQVCPPRRMRRKSRIRVHLPRSVGQAFSTNQTSALWPKISPWEEVDPRYSNHIVYFNSTKTRQIQESGLFVSTRQHGRVIESIPMSNMILPSLNSTSGRHSFA